MAVDAIEGFDRAILPQPQSMAGRFVKGVGNGVTFALIAKKAPPLSKALGTIYSYEIGKEVIKDPTVIKQIATAPETYVMIVGGGLTGLYQERQLAKKAGLKGYGELQTVRPYQRTRTYEQL